MAGWVVVVVPDGMLSITPPRVVVRPDGQPFTRQAEAERLAYRVGAGAYVVAVERSA